MSLDLFSIGLSGYGGLGCNLRAPENLERTRMSLQSHWSERKSQKATPTYHEHEAKREIPIWTGLYTKLMPNEW